MKARAFGFGTGRLGRLSANPTRGAMMARMRYRHISRSIRAAAGAASLRSQGGMSPARITARSAGIGGRACAYKALPPGEIAFQISNTAHIG